MAKKSKYTVVSGIYSTDGLVKEYNSTDFFVRTPTGDIKVTTKKFGKELAHMSNVAKKQVISWVVTKITSAKIDSKGKVFDEHIVEIEDSKTVYELWLKYGKNDE